MKQLFPVYIAIITTITITIAIILQKKQNTQHEANKKVISVVLILGVIIFLLIAVLLLDLL